MTPPSAPQTEASIYPGPSAEEKGLQIDDATRNIPEHGYSAYPPPPPPQGYSYGYGPPPVPPGQYATTNGMYPAGYPTAMPGQYGQVAPAPGTIVSPIANVDEPFNWGIFAGGLCAGTLLSFFGFLFLLCMELRGKRKKAFVIGCSVGLAINFVAAVVIPIVMVVVFATSLPRYY